MKRSTPSFLLISLFTLFLGGVLLLSLNPLVVMADTPPTAATGSGTPTPTVSPTPTATMGQTDSPTPTLTAAGPTATPGTLTATATFTPSAAATQTLTAASTGNPKTPTVSGTPTTSLPTHPRTKKMRVDYTGYLWWVIHRDSNKLLCEVSIEHQDPPTSADIYYACGESIYDKWITTEACDPATNSGNSECSRLYTYLVKKFTAQKDTTVNIDPPSAGLLLAGCYLDGDTNHCNQPPALIIKGEEPMEGEKIIKIHGSANGTSFDCEGDTCTQPLPVTGEEVRFEFWVDSSLGDSSRHFSALVRVLPAPGTGPGQPTQTLEWITEVASSQWHNSPPPAPCAQTWESLPDANGPPAWLSNVSEASNLKSDTQYYYLAGQLILSGQVDTKDCPNLGMQNNETANTCGLEKASLLVNQWQNQFDNEIINAAKQNYIPAQLMKNIISRESQFWPGTYSNTNEVGLGQLTENGADTLLMWNPDFFNNFCPNVFNHYECSKGYNNIPTGERNLLKGSLLSKVNATCINCLTKVDVNQAHFSINVFASSLQANCEQTGQILYNTTGKAAGISSSYEDLWKFTLVNYNAGPGCLQKAIQNTKSSGQPFTWNNVISNLDPVCQGAIPYVQDIINNQTPKGLTN